MYSRRQFIKTTATAAIVAPLIVKSSVISGMGHVAPSDKINLGFIGCGIMGTANLNECVKREDVVLVAAADVWKQRLDAVLNRLTHSLRLAVPILPQPMNPRLILSLGATCPIPAIVDDFTISGVAIAATAVVFKNSLLVYIFIHLKSSGYTRRMILVEALCYKPKGRGFSFR